MIQVKRCVALVVCVLGWVAAGWADGGMFPQLAGSAESADQRAIVAFDDGHQTLILQTAYEGDRAEFAWVIPVPDLLGSGDISTVSADIFQDLYVLTEPSAYGYYGYNAQFLVGCSSGSQPDEFRTVRVWDTLQVDDYEVAILSAGQSADLADWLATNGYAFPEGHNNELDYYVNKSWFFVAVKINPAAARPPSMGDDYGEGTQEMKPLVLSFDTAEPVYPLRISAVSSKDEVEVLLYVISRHRMAASNYHTEEVRLTSPFESGDFPAYYEEQFRASLAGAGAGSVLVEYAGRIPDYLLNAHREELGLPTGEFHVTRLRTYLTQDDMDEDISIVQAPTDDSFAIRIMGGQPAQASLRLGGVAALFALVAIIGIYPGHHRSLLRAGLMVAVAAFIVI